MDVEEQIEVLRRDRSRTGIFVDFDGTLAPIVEDRDAAAIVPGGSDLLSALAGSFPLVALISGRGASDVFARAGARGPRYFGLYGGEEMTEEGLVQSPMAAGWRQTAQMLAEQAVEVIRANNLTGCEVEFKDLAVSLHYRHSGRATAPEPLVEWAKGAAAANGFQLGLGRMVLEFKPRSVSKAATLERLAVQSQIQNAVVAGDDSADVEMMQRAALVIPGALLRVGVRSGEAPAGLLENSDTQVESPREMLSLLERLLG